MSDYPDYTRLMQVIGSDIEVPIDIQGAYIQIPVDIQAQLANIEIDIVAQTVGNIAIDLAAQSVGNILVDIKAQTIGNLVIDIEAQSVGIYSQPEWAAKEGTDKDLSGSQASTNSGSWYNVITYSVPAPKTLLITHCGGYIHAIAGNILAEVRDWTGAVPKAHAGGVQGFNAVFNKPLAIPGGHEVRLIMQQVTGSVATIEGHIGGFEI